MSSKRLVFTLVLFGVFAFLVQAEDHSEHIEGPFESPQEVTATCIMCHDNVADEIMATRHWNWQGEAFNGDGKEKVRLGKINMINNFCIAVPSNWPRCTSCHIGYGWKDETFDHSNPENIDCLVCHDRTGTYSKTATAAGMPAPDVDLVAVAQSVGFTSRQTCGKCHYDGGGGAGVKHGDMDPSLLEPPEDLDVHMGMYDFQCADCHAEEGHKIRGAGHASMAANTNHFDCTTCHEMPIHDKSRLNDHTEHIACETCHIPSFARIEPTKVWWDWSTAGQDRKASRDQFGHENYNKKKGDFVWKKDVQPEYRWHNGGVEYYMFGDKIDTTAIVVLNELNGSIEDTNSKITPFKVMHAKQPFDPVNMTLIVPHLFGPEGYWKTFNWEQAAQIGMEAVGLPFSGNVEFVETDMYWPINHMVAPSEQALRCTDCHGKKSRFDWEALGYPGDPMKKGGRAEHFDLK